MAADAASARIAVAWSSQRFATPPASRAAWAAAASWAA
jgi:hypothetical protein